jgi:hypothetical protein
MAYFPVEGWVAFSVVGVIGILTILNVLARQFQNFRVVHDLRVDATRLRHGYAARLAEMRAKEAGDAGEGVEIAELVEEGELKIPKPGMVREELKAAA